jgi:hypothetical protein
MATETSRYEAIISEAAEKLEARYQEIQEQLAPLREEEREVAEAIHRIVGSYPSGYSPGVRRTRATATRAAEASAGDRERRIIEVLSQNPDGLNGTALSKAVGVSPATGRKTLDAMVEARTITRTGARRATRYFAA